MIRDPAFLQAAAQSGLAISPVSGRELQAITQEIIQSPKPVRDRLVQILGPSEAK